MEVQRPCRCPQGPGRQCRSAPLGANELPPLPPASPAARKACNTASGSRSICSASARNSARSGFVRIVTCALAVRFPLSSALVRRDCAAASRTGMSCSTTALCCSGDSWCSAWIAWESHDAFSSVTKHSNASSVPFLASAESAAPRACVFADFANSQSGVTAAAVCQAPRASAAPRWIIGSPSVRRRTNTADTSLRLSATTESRLSFSKSHASFGRLVRAQVC